MNKAQRVAWALCMIGQCFGCLRWVSTNLRKPCTRQELTHAREALEDLRNTILEEYRR